MAHDIYNNSYAGREAAWHGGLVMANAETMMDLHRAAGLDNHEFQLLPIYWEKVQEDGVYHIQEQKKRLVTLNGNTSLGHIVSDDYRFHQPWELAESMDRILTASKQWAGKDWKPETAMALGNGSTVVYCISLGENVIGGTQCVDYLIVTDWVDGKHSLVPAIVKVKVVCRNTLRLALSSAIVQLEIRHMGNHKENFKASVEAILESQGNIHSAMEKLAAEAISEQAFNKYLNDVFPIPDVDDKNYSKAVVRKMTMLQFGANDNFYRMVEDEKERPTSWVAFNAVQEVLQYGDIYQREKIAAKQLVSGNGPTVQLITKAFTLAQALS